MQVQITGLEQILANVRAIGDGSKQVVRQAVAKGGQVMAKHLKKRVPVGKAKGIDKLGQFKNLKLLQKSIGSKVKTYRGKAVAIIGARVGFKAAMGIRTRGGDKGSLWYQDPSNIAHLVDLGHGGPHPAGGRFFRVHTLNDATSETADVMQQVLEQGLEKLANK
jgi:hypothetical protein